MVVVSELKLVFIAVFIHVASEYVALASSAKIVVTLPLQG